MKVLVTGSSGMLGSDIVDEMSGHHEVVGLARHERGKQRIPFYCVDITNRSRLLEAVRAIKPDVVIHTAAYADVDGCERHPEQAFLVNTHGTQTIAEACSAVGATLFFMSTDYVFDGDKREPYDEDDIPKPISTYGRTKRDAETLLRPCQLDALVIRCSWLFGENGNNFFRSILQKIARREKLSVVDDRHGAPTYTRDLAKVVRSVMEKVGSDEKQIRCRVYHVANSGHTSWFEAAEYLANKAQVPVDLQRMTSRELRRPAKRPQNSVFNTTRLRRDFGIRMRSWKKAVDAYWRDSLGKEWEELTKSHIN